MSGIVRNILMFVIAVYVIGTLKNLMLLTGVHLGAEGIDRVLVSNGDGHIAYAVIDGSDVPWPLTRPYAVKERVIGLARVYYQVLPGTQMKDLRYAPFIRCSGCF